MGRFGGPLFVVAVALFVAAVVYLAVPVARGEVLADAYDDALPWIFAASGLVALVGWRRDRAAALAAGEADRQRLESELREREADRDETREREAAERHAREDLESRLENNARALGRERYLRSRSEEARRSEKEWGRELQAEVMRLYRERGSLGDTSDVRVLVLRMAVTLLEAEKGLLLARREDGGELELAASEGFESDPGESRIARRFAREVIERDVAVREDGMESAGGQPADAEIRNLVAIPIYVRDEFDGVVVCANREGGFEEYEDEVLISLGDQAGAVLETGRLRGELRDSYLATVRMLAEAVEAKDPFLGRHSEEVSGYVAAVADRLGLGEKRREELIFGSLLHDVGKIGISERILLKPGALSAEEVAVVRLHPRIGCRLIERVPALASLAPAILHHHERFDGRGYPSELRGEEIPLEARIICVTDAFSAMTTERPYRRRMTLEEACAELERNAGGQFDPEVVRVFVEVARDRPAAEERLARGAARGSLAAALEAPGSRPAAPEEPILGHGLFSMTDSLTLLYSHRYFREAADAEARRAAARGRPFAVVLVELERIGELNRKEGYAAGDAALRAAARAVQDAAARSGGPAARYAGRRLGLISPDTDEPAAERLADGILAELDGGPVVRAGFACWRPGDDGDAVVVRSLARLNNGAQARR